MKSIIKKVNFLNFYKVFFLCVIFIGCITAFIYDFQKRQTLRNWSNLQQELVKILGHNIKYWYTSRVQETTVDQIEKEIIDKIIKPFKILNNGDAWIYTQDRVIYDHDAAVSIDKILSIEQYFELQSLVYGAKHYDKIITGVKYGTTGTCWYIWNQKLGKEWVAWTSIILNYKGNYEQWTIGISVPEKEILEAVSFKERMSFLFFASIIIIILLLLLYIYRYNHEIALHKEINRATKQFQNTTAQLQAVLYGSKIGYWNWNLSGDFYFSPIFKHMLGYSTDDFEETLGNFYNLIHPDDIKIFQENVDKLVFNKQIYKIHKFEIRMKHRNNTYQWMECILSLIESDDENYPVRIIGLQTNINDRKEMQLKLEKSEKKFKDIINFIPISILICNDLKITYANREFYNFFGNVKDNIYDLFTIEYKSLIEGIDLKNHQIEETSNIYGQFIRAQVLDKNNQIKWANFALKQIEINNKIADLYIIIDIDQQEMVYDELRNLHLDLQNRIHLATKDLEKKNENLKQYSFFVSHELRRPTVNMSIALDYIMKECKAAKCKQTQEQVCLLDFVGKYIEMAKEESLKLTRIVTDISALTVADTKTSTSLNFNLMDALDQALNSLKPQIELKNITIIKPKSLPFINANITEFTSVFNNLIENAIKHSPLNSSIIIKLELVSDLLFKISIIDQGPGFDSSIGDKIFDMFIRLDKDKSGSGLGLAIVKKIIEKYNGYIGYNTKQNEGTSFWFILPY